MGRGGLRDFVVGLGLHGVDEVGEFDRVLDEEDRHVVADEIEVAFLRVELDGEAADVAGESLEPREPATVEKRTKTGVLTDGSCRKLRACRSRHWFVDLEIAVRAGSRGRGRCARECARGRSG